MSFKFNSAEVRPLSKVAVADSRPTQKPASAPAAPVHLTDVGLELRLFIEEGNPRRMRLSWLAGVLRLPIFWENLYWESRNGWGFTNKQNGVRTYSTFDEVDQLIDARCEELDIDRALVEAWGGFCHSLAESQAFDRMPFEERIQSFKKSEVR